MPRHAPHDTRLGRLQRGHGRGFLQALAHPGPARDEVLSCILADPRLDVQVEGRARYYAELAVRVGVRAEPIVEFAIANRDDWLAVDVLAEMAARGDADAAAVLTDPTDDPEVSARMLGYLCDYPHWTNAHVPLVAVDALAEHLHREGDLEAHVEVYGEFWHPWVNQLPRVATAFDDNAAAAAAAVIAAPQLVDDPTALTVAGLLAGLDAHASERLAAELRTRTSMDDRDALAHVVERGDEFGRVRAAAQALADMGDLRLLDLAEQLFALDEDAAAPYSVPANQRQRRRALLSYVCGLPPAVILPLARTWWPRGGYWQQVAGRVFAQHAEARDREWLEAAVANALQHGSGEDVVQELAALEHIGDRRSLPVLLTVVDRAPHSWARTRALLGLAAHGDDTRAGDELALALWDCEEEARCCACARAPLVDPTSRHRVRELAMDPIEDDSVRAAATARAMQHG